jgi:hypothetical protein
MHAMRIPRPGSRSRRRCSTTWRRPSRRSPRSRSSTPRPARRNGDRPHAPQRVRHLHHLQGQEPVAERGRTRPAHRREDRGDGEDGLARRRARRRPRCGGAEGGERMRTPTDRRSRATRASSSSDRTHARRPSPATTTSSPSPSRCASTNSSRACAATWRSRSTATTSSRCRRPPQVLAAPERARRGRCQGRADRGPARHDRGARSRGPGPLRPQRAWTCRRSWRSRWAAARRGWSSRATAASTWWCAFPTTCAARSTCSIDLPIPLPRGEEPKQAVQLASIDGGTGLLQGQRRWASCRWAWWPRSRSPRASTRSAARTASGASSCSATCAAGTWVRSSTRPRSRWRGQAPRRAMAGVGRAVREPRRGQGTAHDRRADLLPPDLPAALRHVQERQVRAAGLQRRCRWA